MKPNILIFIFLFFTFSSAFKLSGQFAPPAGLPGSTAIHKDSSIIIDWAKSCEVRRGFINLADTTASYNGSNRATYGSLLHAYGPSDEYVISLGDHGEALLEFNAPIVNGQGADFAVFENSFGDFFLELAFVEVSSDGSRFVRFPAVSNTQVQGQVTTFGTLDAKEIHNFAGKYRMGYGTPFDLEDLRDSSGIDLQRITHVKIIDAGGCLDPMFATTDSKGQKVNDPWPTPFDTGGFDLDAVGVIHNTIEGVETNEFEDRIVVYPNPFLENITIDIKPVRSASVILFSCEGNILRMNNITAKSLIDLSDIKKGIYILQVLFPDGTNHYQKIIKQ